MPFCVECGKQIPSDASLCPYCGARIAGTTSPPPRSSPSIPFTISSKSGFDALTKDQNAQQYWVKRLVAYIIDSVILSVVLGAVFSIITFPIMGFGVGGPFYNPYSMIGFGIFPLLSGVISVLYFSFTESRFGGSLGKSLMGLKVTKDSGQTLTMDKAFTRNISKIYWALLLLDLIAGLATGTDYRKKFTDKYSETIVVPK